MFTLVSSLAKSLALMVRSVQINFSDHLSDGVDEYTGH